MTSTDVLSHPIYKRDLIRRMVRELEPNDRLSRCCSAIYREVEHQYAIDEDLAMFHAPSECYADAHSNDASSLFTILKEYGYSAKQFCDEVEKRTSYRIVYDMFSPVLELVMIEEDQWHDELDVHQPRPSDKTRFAINAYLSV